MLALLNNLGSLGKHDDILVLENSTSSRPDIIKENV